MSPSLIWTFGSYDFVSQGAVPGLLTFSKSWKTGAVSPPGVDGLALNTSPKLDGMPFTMTGSFRQSTTALLRTSLDNLKNALGAGRQQFKQFDDRYILLLAEHFEEIWLPALQVDFTIDLVASDPYWFSTTLDTSAYTTDDTTSIVTNAGNAPAPVKFTVTAPAGGLTAFTATNSTSGLTLAMTGMTLTSGQILVLDTGAKTITQNGVSSRVGLSQSSTFWQLAAGDNDISLTSTPTGASVSLEKRDRWQ